MFGLLLTVTLALGAPPAGAAIRHRAPRHYWTMISCAGGTVDVVVSVAYSRCYDRRGRAFAATYVGGGWGGIVAASAFVFLARLERGHGIEGHYTGASTSLALRHGGGIGVFTRNRGGTLKPALGASEFLVWVAGHQGFALDLSMLTLAITKL